MIYNGDALEQSLVQIDAQLGPRAGKSRLLRTDPARRAAAIDRLLQGGNLGVLGGPQNLIGLQSDPRGA